MNFKLQLRRDSKQKLIICVIPCLYVCKMQGFVKGNHPHVWVSHLLCGVGIRLSSSRDVSTLMKPFKCETCGSQFADIVSLKIHIRQGGGVGVRSVRDHATQEFTFCPEWTFEELYVVYKL